MLELESTAPSPSCTTRTTNSVGEPTLPKATAVPPAGVGPRLSLCLQTSQVIHCVSGFLLIALRDEWASENKPKNVYVGSSPTQQGLRTCRALLEQSF